MKTYMQTYMKRNENTYACRNLYLNVSNSQEAEQSRCPATYECQTQCRRAMQRTVLTQRKKTVLTHATARESLGHARLGKQPVAADHVQTALWGDTFRQGSPE